MTTTPDSIAANKTVELPVRRTSTLRRVFKDPQAVICLAILAVVFGLGLVPEWISPHDPNAASLNLINAPVGTPGHLLGADDSGRDILSRLLHSVNTSFFSALIGAGVALTVGITFGLIGGYYKVVRGVTEWVFNLLMTFPGILLLIVLMPLTKGDYRTTMFIFGFLMAPGTYRIVRNQVVGVRNELFVDAARVSGLSDVRILAKHIFAAVRGPVIINAAFLSGSAINLQSGLAFLGVGSKEIPSFGAMIAAGFANLYAAPLQFIWPSISLGIITASLVLLGNSLRDVLQDSRPKAAKVGQGIRVADVAQANPAQTPRAAGALDALLVVENLAVAYPSAEGELREVVKGVSLELHPGETLGLVGESGSGKTQTAFSILGVLPPEAVVTRGSILLEGRELVGLSDADLRQLRGSEIAYIPQEPMSNLDPSYTVGSQLVEGVRAVLGLTRREAKARVLALLDRVGIREPERTFNSYPHQISGGMAQRVLIAGAVASRPRVLIADEPTTAVDVTVQAEILDLLRELQEELQMAVIMVTHNFGVVADLADRVAVMKQGEVVEQGDVRSIFANPQHDYTKMLLGSILDEHTVRTDPPAMAGTTKGDS